MQARKTEVLILGAGVIGLATAVALARAGRQVTVLDRAKAGAATSHGNCGTITPSHATPLAMPGMIGDAIGYMLQRDAPFYVKPRFDPGLWAWFLSFARRCNWRDFAEVTRIKSKLLLAGRDELARLIRDEQLDCEFQRLGTFYVFRDPAAMEKMGWLPRALGEVGIPVQVLDGETARLREPALNGSIVGGFLNAGDCHLRPDRYCAELVRVARALGVELVEDTAVTGFETEAGRIAAVHAGSGRWQADEVVLALGSWSPAVAKQLGLRIPIQPGKGYSITYERPALCPSIPVVLKERSVCVTAWGSGYRLGSTMEFSGYDSTLNRTRLAALPRAAAEYLREPVGPTVTEEWYGWRPMTADDLPILGRVAPLSNLVLATGHGMLGVTMSAITAKLIAEVVCGKDTSLDIAPYGLRRFS